VRSVDHRAVISYHLHGQRMEGSGSATRRGPRHEKLIEGNLTPAARVVIVEDVVTRGSSASGGPGVRRLGRRGVLVLAHVDRWRLRSVPPTRDHETTAGYSHIRASWVEPNVRHPAEATFALRSAWSSKPRNTRTIQKSTQKRCCLPVLMRARFSLVLSVFFRVFRGFSSMFAGAR